MWRTWSAVSGIGLIITIMTAVVAMGDAELQRAAHASAGEGILFQESFEDREYVDRFTGVSHEHNLTLVDEAAVGDRALRVRVGEDGHYGTSIRYRFADAGQEEPEVLYARYFLRFGADWEPGRGGKLPGPEGTYDNAGWGGRVPDGTDGWSARGGFREDPDDPQKTQLFFYTYHADLTGNWGENLYWDIDGHGSVERERWYQIDMEVRMNTPGEADGVLRGWVDEQLAFERTDLRFRTTDDLKVQGFWMNLYYGGSWTAPHQMHVCWDGLILSTTPLLETQQTDESAVE